MSKRNPRRLFLMREIDPHATMIEKLKYALKELGKHYRQAHWWGWQVSRFTIGFYYRVIKGNKGIFVVDEDWDNLIILDACRYDVLREAMGKDIDYRTSRGSNTLEWFRENFIDKKYPDIVYVTANPWISKVAGDIFHKIISAWKDGWDDDLGTVHPKTTTEYAKEAAQRYPDKRLIAHYMQPHTPYIEKNDLPTRPWRDLEKGKIDPLYVWSLYKKNLEITLPHVYELVESLEGRTVISADHGELFGKRILGLFPFAGHRWGLHIPELTKIPWVVYKDEPKVIDTKDERQRLKHHIRKLKDRGQLAGM